MDTLGNHRQNGEGNSGTSPFCKKQSNRYTFYAFTLFNYNKNDLESSFNRQLKIYSKKYFYGREICPETQRLHLQGFIHLKKARRITELKLPGNPHLESCIGSEKQNRDYCSKGGDTVSYGYPKPVIIVDELFPWQQNIVDTIITQPVDPRKIHWFWEPLGNIGKSAFVKFCVVKYNALFCDGGKKSDIINLVFNNNMDECNLLIWDIPRINLGSVSYSAIESIKNGLVCNTKYETGTKVFNPPHIIVFANCEPANLEALSADRWNIHRIT
mgnify:CR=1 FL=1